MLLSCIGLTTLLWAWAWWRTDAHTGWPAWPIQLWAGIGLVNAVASTDLAGRRALVGASVLLLASVQAIQAWHLQMPYEDWLAAGMPDKPTLATWPDTLHAQLHHALSLRWVRGCSTLPWQAWLLAAPFCLGTQFINGNHPVMPAWSRALAKVALVCWASTLMLALGMLMVGPVKGAPFWFWGLLVILLPLQIKSTTLWLLVPAWLSSLAGLLVAVLAHVINLSFARDAALALSVALTLLNWLVWYVRMDAMVRFDSVLAGLRELFPEAPPSAPVPAVMPQSAYEAAPDATRPVTEAPFDLQAHLDSPQAQEGADKYTRE